ncbi:hypothetical protein D3C85_806000 [compost metagenome]
MEFEHVSYIKFEGNLLAGTIGEDGLQPYLFTRLPNESIHSLGRPNKSTHVLAAYSEIVAAAKAIAQRRLTRDVKQEQFILTLGGSNRKIPDDMLDALERELNVLVSAWHEKK